MISLMESVSPSLQKSRFCMPARPTKGRTWQFLFSGGLEAIRQKMNQNSNKSGSFPLCFEVLLDDASDGIALVR